MSYHCFCDDCQQEEVRNSWEGANTFFEAHAKQGHTVEITQQGCESILNGDG